MKEKLKNRKHNKTDIKNNNLDYFCTSFFWGME